MNFAICRAVFEEINISKIFKTLDTHNMEVPPTDNHVVFLIKNNCFVLLQNKVASLSET